MARAGLGSARLEALVMACHERSADHVAFRGDRFAQELALRQRLKREIEKLCRPLFLQLTPDEKAAIHRRVFAKCRR